LNHIKNVFDAQKKLEIDRIYNEGQLIEKTDRVYKPSYTIEFNREGEVLLYSCDTYKHVKYLKPVYFKIFLFFKVDGISQISLHFL
jgi:hypothetical protein